MVDVAENGACGIQREKKTGRSGERLKVPPMILVPVCSQDGYKPTLTTGPSEDRCTITAIRRFAVWHLGGVYHTARLRRSQYVFFLQHMEPHGTHGTWAQTERYTGLLCPCCAWGHPQTKKIISTAFRLTPYSLRNRGPSLSPVSQRGVGAMESHTFLHKEEAAGFHLDGLYGRGTLGLALLSCFTFRGPGA